MNRMQNGSGVPELRSLTQLDGESQKKFLQAVGDVLKANTPRADRFILVIVDSSSHPHLTSNFDEKNMMEVLRQLSINVAKGG